MDTSPVLFRDGGSCGRRMTPAEFVDAHRKGRVRHRIQARIAFLGTRWLMHPLNPNGWNYHPEPHVLGENDDT